MKNLSIILLGLIFTSSQVTAAEEPPNPMKIALFVGMTNLPNDTSNVNCQSNIISRPVPATHANIEAEVNKLKAKFFDLCQRQSGRKITHEGNYQWKSNQYGGRHIEDRRIHKNDIHVNMN